MVEKQIAGSIHRLISTGILLMVALFIVACGGGGGASNTDRTFTGTITGFGSIFVNSVEIETNSASVSIDDAAGDENDLKVGMQVTVVGNVDANGTTGTATTIIYSDDLEGIVISNGISTGQTTGDLNVMGQTVTVSTDTIVEGVVTPDLIVAGMIIEVSGHSSGTGTIQATRIEVKATDLTTYLATHAEGIEVKGVIANHDEVNSKFDIGGITVDYSAATLDNMPIGNFDTLYVEVKSTAGIDSGSGELIASVVELESNGDKGHDGADNEEVTLKGLITSDINGDSFDVDGVTVTVDANTEYDGIVKSNLLTGVMVEVEGYYLNGLFIVEEVEVEQESSSEIKDTVANIVTTATNTGTVTLTSGSVVTITSATIMKDSRDNGFIPDPKFNLQSLAVGDYVEIHYYVDNGENIATKLERDDI